MRRQRTKEVVKIVLAALFFIGFIWSVSYVSGAPQVTVQHIIVSGNSVVTTDQVVGVTESAMRGNLLGLFSNANILWYPKNKILNSLKYSYSWIDTVSINRVDLNTIEIKIKERVPVAVWCGLSISNPQPCRLVDGNGYVFAQAPDFAGPAYLKLYGPLTSASWRGAEFFSQDGLNHIFNFTKGLTGMQLKPVAAEVSLNSPQEEYAAVLAGGTHIMVQVDGPIPTLLMDLQSLFSQKSFMQSSVGGYSNLVSVDLRFGNKIFYKFTTTATSSQM